MMKRMGLCEGDDDFLAPKGSKESEEDYWDRRLDPNVEVNENTDELKVYKKQVQTKDGKHKFGSYLSDDEIEILNKSWPEISKMIDEKPTLYQLS